MSPLWYFTTSALLFHIIAALSFLWKLPKEPARIRHLVDILPIGGAALSLTAGCFYTLYQSHTLPAWTVLLAAALSWLGALGALRWHLKSSATLVSPLCILVICLGLISGGGEPEVSFLRDLHILTAILGQAMAMAVTCVSFIFLTRKKGLKNKALTPLRLTPGPSLERLTHLLSTTLYLTVVLFSLALLSGVTFVTSLSFSQVPHDLWAKITWALAVWSFYLYLLYLKKIHSPPPSQIARLSIWGGVIHSLAFVIVNKMVL